MPPITVLIKPASGNCNMRCTYCFYYDEQANRETASYGLMSRETAHLLIDRAMGEAEGSVLFAFQGGEPTLMGLDFYRDFTDYAASRPERKRLNVSYALQTNGYALNEEWAAFFAKHRFLVGVSLDGTKDLHDRYRLDAAGKGTYNRVRENLRLLEKHKVDFNILTVVTGATARRAGRIYRFFQGEGYDYQQYIECLDPLGEAPGGRPWSLTPEKYGEFLKNLFDVWYRDRMAGKKAYNRYFENLLLILDGQMPESCNMMGVCGRQWVVEADGGVYPCDFYVLDEWKLGSVRENSFAEMEEKRKELGFIEASRVVPEKCRSCQWYPLCRNGCRRNRTEDGAEGPINYFCEAYKGFFEYAYPRLRELYLKLRRGG